MKRLAILAACGVLAGCVGGRAVPETVDLETGTSIRHEVGEPAARQTTALVRVRWRLR